MVTEILNYPFKAHWSLYVPQGLTFNNSTFCSHSVFMCSVWMSEQTAIISLYCINWLVFITEKACVYCAVRTVSLTVTQVWKASRLLVRQFSRTVLSTDLHDVLNTKTIYIIPLHYTILYYTILYCGGAVGWGTALQVGRSRVRFPMLSLEFFIDITLPAIVWFWGWLIL